MNEFENIRDRVVKSVDQQMQYDKSLAGVKGYTSDAFTEQRMHFSDYLRGINTVLEETAKELGQHYKPIDRHLM